MENCLKCGKKIKVDEQVYQCKLGKFNIEDEGAILLGFKEVESCSVHGYFHVECLEE